VSADVGYLRALVHRVAKEDCGIAFVVGWRVHRSTERAAFRRGLLVDVDTNVWTPTETGWRLIGEDSIADEIARLDEGKA
jgi:hypothetical protein